MSGGVEMSMVRCKALKLKIKLGIYFVIIVAFKSALNLQDFLVPNEKKTWTSLLSMGNLRQSTSNLADDF